MNNTTINSFVARWNRFIVISIPLVLSVVTTIVYYPSLWYGFIFDDLPTITQYVHNRVVDFKGQFFANPRWISRILNQLTYRYWGSSDPFPYRIVDLGIHIFVGVCIFFMLKTLFSGCRKNQFLSQHALSLATITSMLFLLHPVQTQTVTYITQMRLEGLVVLFTTLVLMTFVYAQATKSKASKIILYSLSFVLTAFAAGTKEIIIVLPVLIVLVDWFFIAEGDWQSFRSRLWIHAFYGAILFGVMLKYGLLTPRYVTSITANQLHNNRGNILTANAQEPITLLPYALSQFKVIVHYLMIFLFPVGLSFDYGTKLSENWYGADVLLPLFFLMSIAAWAIWLYRRQTAHILSFCIAWFFITILPRASIFPSTELVCDYKTYPAAFGVMLGVAYILVKGFHRLMHAWPMMETVRQNQVIKFGAQLAFCATLAFASHVRNFVWSSELVFWKDVIDKSPKARALNNYAIALWDNGKTQDAMNYFHEAIAKDDWYAEPHVNLATIYQMTNNTAKALEHYKRALDIGEGHPELFHNLGVLHLAHQSFQSAEYCFMQAIQLRPHHAKAHLALGRLYQAQNRRDSALKSFQQAIASGLQDQDTYYAHGSLALEMGKTEDAIASLELVNKQYQDTAFLLGCCYYNQRNYEKSVANFAIAHKKDPSNKVYVYNYAQSLLNVGNYKDALVMFQLCMAEQEKYPYAALHRARCLYELGLKDDAKSALKLLTTKTTPDALRVDAMILQRDLRLA